MLTAVLKRLAWAVPLLFSVTFSVFLLFELAPGGIARSIAGENATPEMISAIEARLGLDRPLMVRYGEWAWNALQGDFGESLRRHDSVTNLIAGGVGATASIGIVAMIIGIVVGSILGVSSIMFNAYPMVDRFVGWITSIMISSPAFYIGLVLVVVVSLQLGWLPATGYRPISEGVTQWMSHIILPGIALSGIVIAEVARQLRASVSDEMRKPYVDFARSKGISGTKLYFRHVLRNAAIPTVTVAGFRLISLIGSAVAVERVFAINGLATVLANAVLVQDVTTVLGVISVVGLFVVLVNLIVDLLYFFLNPKIRHS